MEGLGNPSGEEMASMTYRKGVNIWRHVIGIDDETVGLGGGQIPGWYPARDRSQVAVVNTVGRILPR